MRQAHVLYKGKEAGMLTQTDDGHFKFHYTDTWFQSRDCPAISLTLPKDKQDYESEFLFPCFYNMLPEGSNKVIICYEFRIDAKDYFGLLLHTARYDSIGAITVIELNDDART